MNKQRVRPGDMLLSYEKEYAGIVLSVDEELKLVMFLMMWDKEDLWSGTKVWNLQSFDDTNGFILLRYSA